VGRHRAAAGRRRTRVSGRARGSSRRASR
jgi:hypothetical protein